MAEYSARLRKALPFLSTDSTSGTLLPVPLNLGLLDNVVSLPVAWGPGLSLTKDLQYDTKYSCFLAKGHAVFPMNLQSRPPCLSLGWVV